MRGKTKFWLKKTKMIWGIALIWTLLGLAILCGLNWAISSPNGQFDKKDIVYEETYSPRYLNRLEIAAEKMNVEIGMSDSARQIKVSLIGAADLDHKNLYCEQKADDLKVQAKGKGGDILRIILPQNDLISCFVLNRTGRVDIRDFRTDSLKIDTNGYDVRLSDIKSDRLEVHGEKTNIRIQDSLGTSVYLENPLGNLDLRHNDFANLHADSGGKGFLYDSNWSGQWLVKCDNGIWAVSKRTPYSLLLELHAYGMKNGVGVGYQGYWGRHSRIAEKDQHRYLGICGNNPKNSLTLISANGNVFVQKRIRKTVIPAFDQGFVFNNN